MDREALTILLASLLFAAGAIFGFTVAWYHLWCW